MASIIGAASPYRSPEKAISSSLFSDESDSNPVDAVIFAGTSLVLGTACRQLFNGTRVPYTVVLLVIGIVLGSLEYGTKHNLGKIGNGIRIWYDINPDLLLAVFLPALLFESSFSMDVHQIKRCMGQMVLLAGPGVLISTFCLGALIKLTFPYNWDWKTSLLLGGLLGATDPVAVVALLKELGASKKMTTLIDGESLMNDGVSVVVFQLFFKMVMGQNSDWGSIIKFLVQNSLGAVGIGLAFGIASVIWLKFVFNDTVVQITVTLSVSYFAYYTAQEWAGVSGILTVMVLGMFFAAFARTAVKGESHQSLHHFWEMAAYIANTLVFILSGVIIAEGVLSGRRISYQGISWGFLFLLYLYVQLSRCVGCCVTITRSICKTLGHMIQQSSGNLYLSSETGTRFLFFTGGIVFLTLVVNGSTTQLLLHFLRMDTLTASKKRILEYTKCEMVNTALKAFENLGDDEELGSANWPTVTRHVTSLKDLEGGQANPHKGYEAGNLDPTNIMDMRIRFLNGVQAAYWEMLDDGRITRSTANVLMQSVDEALDLVSTNSLCDWRGLEPRVHFPNYYKFLQSRIIPRKLVTHLIVERLESACYISSAFLRAHRIARQQLHDFLGNSDVASTVISESEVEGVEAKQFLEDVRDSFPQVLSVLKTRQVTHYVLNHLNGYIKNLEKVGLLEGKEVSHLHDVVQSDLKKLVRNPPLLKLPNIEDFMASNPLLKDRSSFRSYHV
ncbi:PREDICTED: sodium/hydrogen exchanger 8 isoform X3 [Camelina sativa]|uniref:Sodium/hydrogen exchanger 8 isoform X3 n=1 Tax=Camelina sativa TaxID=90675 RepID=A0ABM0Y6M0_CAMSA|nr:PREDICTED: sodium/hydrogen exchanger 8 isoform X3 [Camelina sativa]